MNKLTRDHLKQRDDYVKTIKEAGESLREAIENYNNKIEEERSTLEQAVSEFNEAVMGGKERAAVDYALSELNETIQNAENCRSKIYDEIELYLIERSDKWKESETGSQYQSWVETFSEEFGEVKIDFNNEEAELATIPEPIDEVSVGDIVDVLKSLPRSPAEV